MYLSELDLRPRGKEAMSTLYRVVGATTLVVLGLTPVAHGTPRLSSAPGTAVQEAAAPADHHMHVWSADARDLLVEAQRAVGQEVIAEEDARALTGADAVAALDSAGIRRGVVLSNAYFFGIPDVEVKDEYARTRAENDFVARQVSQYPDRLVGFFSVNPLADYAIGEIDRLADRPEFVGLKLHLGNSNVDLRDPAHVHRLREVFARANEAGLAIVIHIGGRSADFGAADAEAFLTEVLPAAPDVPVQLAHMAGPGGFGPGTQASFETFAAAIERDAEATENLLFDLSGVPHPISMAQGDTTLIRRIEEINGAFLEAARAVGFDRVVFGSDYPAISVPLYFRGIRETLPLSDAEFRDLVDDPAPYLP